MHAKSCECANKQFPFSDQADHYHLLPNSSLTPKVYEQYSRWMLKCFQTSCIFWTARCLEAWGHIYAWLSKFQFHTDVLTASTLCEKCKLAH